MPRVERNQPAAPAKRRADVRPLCTRRPVFEPATSELRSAPATKSRSGTLLLRAPTPELFRPSYPSNANRRCMSPRHVVFRGAMDRWIGALGRAPVTHRRRTDRTCAT